MMDQAALEGVQAFIDKRPASWKQGTAVSSPPKKESSAKKEWIGEWANRRRGEW